jgi:hypothetical protein
VEAGTKADTKCVAFCGFGSCDSKPACPDGGGVCVHFTRDPDGIGECTPEWNGPGIAVDVDAGPGSSRDASVTAHD